MKPTQAQIEERLYMKGYMDGSRETKAALTAAAQVGEQEHTYTQSQADSMVRQTWSATIERCAQVAEQVNVDPWAGLVGPQIAAAIRKLKDAP